jgi:thioredoxin 1
MTKGTLLGLCAVLLLLAGCSGNGAESATGSAEVKQITDGSFVSDTASGVALVDFWAPWCKPCLRQAPIVEKIAREFAGRVTVGKLNVDKNQQTARKFGIRSIPTIIIFKDGRKVEQVKGVHAQEQLSALLKKYISR